MMCSVFQLVAGVRLVSLADDRFITRRLNVLEGERLSCYYANLCENFFI